MSKVSSQGDVFVVVAVLILTRITKFMADRLQSLWSGRIPQGKNTNRKWYPHTVCHR